MNQLKSGSHWLLTIITILIYAIFTCSVVYNYAYFLGLGINLSQIPISVGDVINSALSWSPIVLGAAILEAFIVVMIFPYHKSTSKKRSFTLTKNIPFSPRIQTLINAITIIVIVLSLATILLIGQVDNSLSGMFSIISSILLLAFTKFMLSKKIRRSKRMKRLFSILIMSIMMLGFIFVLGYETSANELTQKKSDGSVYLKEEPLKPIAVNILRNLDKGVIVIKMGDTKATFIPWDEIYKIDEKITKTRFEGLLYKLMPPDKKIDNNTKSTD